MFHHAFFNSIIDKTPKHAVNKEDVPT